MKIRHSTIILGLIILMFLFDGANSVLMNLGFSFFRVSIFVRLPVQVYFLFLLLRTRKGLRVWLMVLFFYFVFLVGTWATLIRLDVNGEYDFLGNFRDINKMLFFFICYRTLEEHFRTVSERNSLFTVYETLILTQSAVIIVSFALDIDFFQAYGGRGRLPRRFGYQGLIPAQNEISPFFLGAFFYYLFKVNNLRRGTLALMTTTIAGVLTGTKVTLVLPVILMLYLLSYVVDHFVKAKAKFSMVYLFIGIMFLFLFVLAVWQWDYVLTRISPTISYYGYRASQDPLGMRGALSAPSRRARIEKLFSEEVPRFNVLNFLFGGIDLAQWATETDLVDLFVRLGLVGGVTFYFFYIKMLIPESTILPTRLLFVLTWLGVSTVVGHIAFTAINGTYLAILLLFFSSVESDGPVQAQSKTGHEALNLELHNEI